MTDREKLIDLLETHCAVIGDENCKATNGEKCSTKDCANCLADHLIAHGVTVREKQKPLTLEELKRIEEQPVWCETEATRTPCVVKCSLIDKEDAIFYALGSEYPILFSVETYGQIWRCWAEKPTEEERKAAEW